MLVAEKLAENRELAGEAFNFSNELQLTVLDIVDMIRTRMGSNLEPVVLNQTSNEIKHQYLSAEKARRVLGWQPTSDMESSIDRTIEWYRDHLEI